MVNSVPLILAALEPVLDGTAFIELQPSGRDLSASIVWCTASERFAARHPYAPIPDMHGGCVDLSDIVDRTGHLERADLESINLDDGLVGQPIHDALPSIASRLADLLRQDHPVQPG